MKARISKLSPEIERMIRQKVEEQVGQERGWMKHCVVLMVLWIFNKQYGWGHVRLERLYEQIISGFNELTSTYGYDCWYDKVLSDLRYVGIDLKEDGYAIQRAEAKAIDKAAAQNLPLGTQAKIKAIQEEMRRCR
jgi:hypothetical protein